MRRYEQLIAEQVANLTRNSYICNPLITKFNNMEKKTMTLNQIIRLYNGLNVITNAGVGIKDLQKAFDFSIYKAEADKLYKAFTEAASKAEGDEASKQKEMNELLTKEYEIEVPSISLDDFKDSQVEVPLVAMDYLQEFITR